MEDELEEIIKRKNLPRGEDHGSLQIRLLDSEYNRALKKQVFEKLAREGLIEEIGNNKIKVTEKGMKFKSDYKLEENNNKDDIYT